MLLIRILINATPSKHKTIPEMLAAGQHSTRKMGSEGSYNPPLSVSCPVSVMTSALSMLLRENHSRRENKKCHIIACVHNNVIRLLVNKPCPVEFIRPINNYNLNHRMNSN